MNDIIHQLAKGQLPEQKLLVENNIIGDMAQSVNALSESFTKTSKFANEIEKGNFSVQYNKLSTEDILGNALITMRDSLQIYSSNLNQKVTESANEVIEKRKKIEEQTLFYESIFSNIPIEIAIFDQDFKYLFVNTIGVKDAELRKQIIGKDYFEYCRIKNYDTENAFKRYEIFKSVIQTGTVTAIGHEAGLIDKDGNVPNNDRILLVDSIAAAAGGAAGISSNTSYIESASGVGEGARTGLASVVTGICFLLATFLSPLVAIIPYEAATPALVIVGFLMMTQVKDIDWADLGIAIPAFLTIILMPFTYSISVGIGAGFVSHVLIRTVQGRRKDVHPLLWLVAVLFVIYFMTSPITAWIG